METSSGLAPRRLPSPARVGARILYAGWPYGLFAILVAAYFYPLLASSRDDLIAAPDIQRYFRWLHGYARDRFLAGSVPLWNPFNYCGIPFAANPQCTVFYPPSWVYLLVPVIHAHKWMIALHVLMAGSFMFLFLRRLKMGQAAAVTGCLPWMFGSYVMANAAVGHLTMLFTMAWMPLALYGYEGWLETGRFGWVIFTGLVMGVQVLAGEPQNSYYTVLLVTGYGLLRVISGTSPGSRRWHPRRYVRWAGGLAAVGLVAALASGIQLLPTAEFIAHSDRSESTYAFATELSFAPEALLGFLIPWSNELRGLAVESGGQVHTAYLHWEWACYVGIFTFVLAGVSLGVRGRPSLLAVKCLCAFAVLLMLGSHTPVYAWFFKFLPGLKMFRIPARAIVIVIWTLSVMSAFGLERLLDTRGRAWQVGWWRYVSIVALAAVCACVLVFAVFIYPRVIEVVRDPSDWWKQYGRPITFSAPTLLKPTLVLLAALVLVIVLRWVPRPVAGVLIAAFIAADLFAGAPAFPLHRYSSAEDGDLQSMMRVRQEAADGQPFRVDFAPSQVMANAAIGAGVENVNGYWPVALRRFYRFVHSMRRQKAMAGERCELHDSLYAGGDPFPLRVLNVRYASRFDRRKRAFVRVEDNAHLPRAWVVDRAEVLADEEAILRRMGEPGFDPAATVILEDAPRISMTPANSPVGTCRVRKDDNGDLDIQTNTTRDGYLVFSEIFYPGWHATLDGRDVAPERADYLITALPLPAGSHRVSYRYRPLSLSLGAGCTALCGVAGVASLMLRRLRPSGTVSAREGAAPAET